MKINFICDTQLGMLNEPPRGLMIFQCEVFLCNCYSVSCLMSSHLYDASSDAVRLAVHEILREPDHLGQPVHHDHLQLGTSGTRSLYRRNIHHIISIHKSKCSTKTTQVKPRQLIPSASMSPNRLG